MALPSERADGYSTPEVASLWHKHITQSEDPFRLKPGGLYDRIGNWVEAHNLGSDSRIIDVCCGQGVTSKIASDKLGTSVTGVDISAPLIQIARNYYSDDHLLSFQEGDAGRLTNFMNGEFAAGMMINGIFHLSPHVMELAVAELARVSKGPILITTVNPRANEFFSSAFTNQIRIADDVYDELGLTVVVFGDPSVAGPNGERITLKNTPFYWHPMTKVKRTFEKAGLEIADYTTFGPTSDVGGPDGLDLFAAIQLEHIK